MPRRGHSQVESRHTASEKTIADAMAHSVDTNASLLKQAKQKCQNRRSQIKKAVDGNPKDQAHYEKLAEQIQRLSVLLIQKKATEAVESVQEDLVQLRRIAARAQKRNWETMTHIVHMGAEMPVEADVCSRVDASLESVAKAKASEAVRCHTAVDVDRLSTYMYGSQFCHAQFTPPPIREEQFQDFLTFCAVRNAISGLRPVMSSLRVFEVLIQKYERNGVEDKVVWVKILRHMYLQTKTPIYSIMAAKDPCVQYFHELIQAAITLGHPRLFFVVLLLFSKCTNQKMMCFLKTLLTEVLDEKKFGAWLASRAKSDLEALEKAGGLKACTKLGNGPNNHRVADIMTGLNAIAESDFTNLENVMQSILAGEVECNGQIRELSHSWGFRYIGSFKSYFASKMLKEHVDTVSIASVVGPNLEVDRDAGSALY